MVTMAENEDEETASEVRDSDLTNYYGEADGQNRWSDHLNVKKTKESSTIWPNQKCLSDIIVERIDFILKNRMKYPKGFKTFKKCDIQVRNFQQVYSVTLSVMSPFFQIYTANMIVLESQTLNRMMETFGVLPTEMSELINTPAEGKITK